jgi:Tol biopolymer transport system component
VDVHSRSIHACIALGLLLLAVAGCSKSQTSPNVICDNEGTDLIAFASDRGHAGKYDVYLFDADAGGFRALRNLNSTTASSTSPALSPDGQLVAFVSTRTGASADLYVYERVSCTILSTPGLISAGDESDPAFTGNSSRLAFVRDTLGHRRIRLINGGTFKFETLPGLDTLAATYDDWAPAPDLTGDRIAFVSDREGSPHVYLYDRPTRTVDSLATLRVPGATDLDPALTPDAHTLCFASDRPGGRGGYDIWRVDLTAANRTATEPPGLNTPGNERSPTIGLTVTFIAFQSDSSATAGSDVRYYSVAGVVLGTPSVLAGPGSDDRHPSGRLP